MDRPLQTSSLVFQFNNEIQTIREVVELLKINEKTFYKLASADKIPIFKIGESGRFQPQVIAD